MEKSDRQAVDIRSNTVEQEGWLASSERVDTVVGGFVEGPVPKSKKIIAYWFRFRFF
jgi:hypothetical protein